MPLLVRFADWPLRTKMAVLLLVASLLPMLAVNWLSMRQIGFVENPRVVGSIPTSATIPIKQLRRHFGRWFGR